MNNLIIETAWLAISTKLHLPIDDCKKVIINALERLESGKAKTGDFSKPVWDCLVFYSTFKDVLNG